MPEPSVACPECGVKLRLSPAVQGKPAVRCPKCGATVRLDRPKPPRKAEEPVEEELEEVQEVLPAVPRQRRRPADEDDDDDEVDDRPRPRRRKRVPEVQKEGPWLIALALLPVCLMVGFCGGLAFMGTQGLPEAKEGGPLAKVFGLLMMLVICGVLILLGVLGVKNRRAMGRWGMELTGTQGVALGFVQALMGSLLAGFALYGLIFGVIIFTGHR